MLSNASFEEHQRQLDRLITEDMEFSIECKGAFGATEVCEHPPQYYFTCNLCNDKPGSFTYSYPVCMRCRNEMVRATLNLAAILTPCCKKKVPVTRLLFVFSDLLSRSSR